MHPWPKAISLCLAIALGVLSACSGSANEQRREAEAAANGGLQVANALLKQHKQVELDHNRVALFIVEPNIGGLFGVRRMHTAPVHAAVRRVLTAPPYNSEVVDMPGEILPSEMFGGVDARMTQAGAERAVFIKIEQSGDAVLVDIGLRGPDPQVVVGRMPIEPSKLTYVNPVILLITLGIPLGVLGLAAFRRATARGTLRVDLRRHPRTSDPALVLAISSQPVNARVGDPASFRRQFRQLGSTETVKRFPLGEAAWPAMPLRPGTWYVQVYGVYDVDGKEFVVDDALQKAVTLEGGATATIAFDLAPDVVVLGIHVMGSRVEGLLAWIGRDRGNAVTTNAEGKALLCGAAGNHDLHIECDGVVVRRGVVLITGRDQEVQINIDRERTLAKSTMVGAASHNLAGAGLGPVEARIMAPMAAKVVAMPQPGEIVFDRFEITKLLGHGMGGPVFVASDARTQKEVIMRVLPASARHDQFAYLQFVANVETLAQLRHPNIARIYQVASEGERVFIISAKIDGSPLQSFIDKRGALPLPQSLEIARQLAVGLGALHDINIHHRNLSPRDIFITHGQEVQIADIGLQQLMDVMSHGNVAVRGDVEYLPPELLGGGHSFEARSDLYSLGCVLYAMIAGKPPFPGSTAARDHSYSNAPRLSHTVPGIPKHVDDFVAMCLAKSPAERPKSAQQAAAFLERAIAKLATTQAS